MPDFNVAGKRVLITGGTGGIGGAFARAFLEHGAQVIVADLAAPPADADARIRHEPLDVRDDTAVEALAARIDTLDVLIHCAGRASPGEYEPDIFADVLDVHLVGGLRLVNAFHPHLKASAGCVINIASMYSFFGSPMTPAYGAAKAGVVALTRSLALRFAADGIRVNAIAPGWIDTALTRAARDNKAFFEHTLSRIPIGRWAEPDEVAGAAVFLASPAARLITGITLPVDGGYSAA